LLVIDELDASVKSEFGQRKLKRIIDERYMANLPTIMITNHDKNKLYELLPAPVISRIRENGKGFSFDWASFRDLVCQ
jgi:DNA replication protein DnaC